MQLKKIKLGLFPKVVIAIALGALLGLFLPDVFIRIFKTFKISVETASANPRRIGKFRNCYFIDVFFHQKLYQSHLYRFFYAFVEGNFAFHDTYSPLLFQFCVKIFTSTFELYRM